MQWSWMSSSKIPEWVKFWSVSGKNLVHPCSNFDAYFAASFQWLRMGRFWSFCSDVSGMKKRRGSPSGELFIVSTLEQLMFSFSWCFWIGCLFFGKKNFKVISEATSVVNTSSFLFNFFSSCSFLFHQKIPCFWVCFSLTDFNSSNSFLIKMNLHLVSSVATVCGKSSTWYLQYLRYENCSPVSLTCAVPNIWSDHENSVVTDFSKY